MVHGNTNTKYKIFHCSFTQKGKTTNDFIEHLICDTLPLNEEKKICHKFQIRVGLAPTVFKLPNCRKNIVMIIIVWEKSCWLMAHGLVHKCFA